MTETTPARRGRGRRPADEVRAEVLAAAGELLLGEGMGAFTFERVAGLSGASKVTLYKWWPSPGALALEAYFRAVQERLDFPDTGDIETDLTTQVRSFVTLLSGREGSVIRELIGHAQTDPELWSAFREHYTRPRRDLAITRMTTARAQGQIRADVDLETVVDQLWGAGYHRLLLPDEPLTDAFVISLVHNIITGIRPTPTRD